MIALSSIRIGVGARFVCAWFVACFVLSIPVSAADRNRAISQYTHTAWTAKDGIPGPVNAIAQTQDGYLWLGTEAGLYRFDGLHFVPWEPAHGEWLAGVSVRSLHTANDGSLWIGFGTGGVSRLYSGNLTTYLPGSGVPQGRILSIVSDRSGAVWIASPYGLSRFSSGKWQRIAAEEGYPAPAAQSLFIDHGGTLWVATDGFDFHLSRDPTRPNTVLFLAPGAERFRPSEMAFGQITQMAEAPDGSVWAADTSGRAAKRLSRSSWRDSVYVRDDEVTCLLFGTDHTLWIGLIDRGIRRIGNPPQDRTGVVDRFQPGDGLSNGRVLSVLKDREGNIWFGTEGGLDRFRQDKFIPFSAREGLVKERAIALAASGDGSVWTISSCQNSVYRFHGDRLSATTLARYSPGDTTRILSIYADNDSSVWLGGSFGLAHGSNGHFSFVHYPGLLPLAMIEAITKDASGRLWVTASNNNTAGAIFRLDGHTWTDVRAKFDLPHVRSPVLYTDGSGNVWFGFENGEVALYQNNQVRLYSRNEGLPGGRILTIMSDRSGAIWIGSEGGLSRFEEGHFTTLTQKSGLPGNTVAAILEEDDGWFWIAGGLGILRVAPRELQEALRSKSYRMQGVQLDGSDGLRGLPRQQRPFPTAVRAADGRLWFATAEGVAAIDPRHMPVNTLVPQINIEEVKVDDHAFVAAGETRLRPGIRNLQFKFDALSLTAPERVKFRYRLEGFDDNWRGPVNDRQVTYTNLPPGSYRFRVIACNNDGVWNEEGAARDFIIPPTFLQSSLFKGVCFVALVTLVWLAYRFRMNQLTGRLRTRICERTAERERIARDLHDTFFQSVQGLLLRFHIASSCLSEDHPARRMLEQVLTQSDDVMAEGRDLLVDLHAKASKANDLPAALAEYGEQMQDGLPSAFKVALNGGIRPLHPLIFEEVSRIGKEALSNAFRHSKAHAIEAELTYEPSELRMRIRDNGSGIDANILKQGHRYGHLGLASMRERAKSIGAQLDFWSRTGVGTEVELRIPASLAYASEPHRSSLAKLRRLWQRSDGRDAGSFQS